MQLKSLVQQLWIHHLTFMGVRTEIGFSPICTNTQVNFVGFQASAAVELRPACLIKIGLIGCSETSLNINKYKMGNVPEERSPKPNSFLTEN
jgi:hypothetical protein